MLFISPLFSRGPERTHLFDLAESILEDVNLGLVAHTVHHHLSCCVRVSGSGLNKQAKHKCTALGVGEVPNPSQILRRETEFHENQMRARFGAQTHCVVCALTSFLHP